MNGASGVAALTFDELKDIVQGTAAAFRVVTKLLPAGGPSDKVFPPTYEGARYATEKRLVDGVEVQTVLLDSVQSQANRMELALRSAYERGEVRFPLPVVDFSGSIPHLGKITALDAPHRVADAIFRDSQIGGRAFRDSPEGRSFTDAKPANATALFAVCPTALIFGLWDSTGPRGGAGAKFARAFVSEIVGFHATLGVKTSSRIDPLQILAEAGPIFEQANGGWTLDEAQARRDERGNPVRYGGQDGRGRPSGINHGNILPTIQTDDQGMPLAGGVTIAYALQTTVLSLPALRKLRFPLAPEAGGNGQKPEAVNVAARTLLAALALVAMVYQREDGYDLRSRCLLVPSGSPGLEVVDAAGNTRQFQLGTTEAKETFGRAVDAVRAADLPWRPEEIVLTPSENLVALIRRSEALWASASGQ